MRGATESLISIVNQGKDKQLCPQEELSSVLIAGQRRGREREAAGQWGKSHCERRRVAREATTALNPKAPNTQLRIILMGFFSLRCLKE